MTYSFDQNERRARFLKAGGLLDNYVVMERLYDGEET